METPVRKRAFRIARPCLLCAALLVTGACTKTPDNPAGPQRAAPKAAVTLPLQPGALPPSEPASGLARIPAFPADTGAPALPRKPARIWM